MDFEKFQHEETIRFLRLLAEQLRSSQTCVTGKLSFDAVDAVETRLSALEGGAK